MGSSAFMNPGNLRIVPPPVAPPALPRFAIETTPEALARLTAEVWMAFKRVPRRGLEIGGVLLGAARRSEQVTTFRMEGYETVESEHRSGPSYLLSETDRVRFHSGSWEAHDCQRV